MSKIPKVPAGFKASVPSPAEVTRAKTKRGGWTRTQLAAWGVPWPPKKGWRAALTEIYERELMVARFKAEQ